MSADASVVDIFGPDFLRPGRALGEDDIGWLQAAANYFRLSAERSLESRAGYLRCAARAERLIDQVRVASPIPSTPVVLGQRLGDPGAWLRTIDRDTSRGSFVRGYDVGEDIATLSVSRAGLELLASRGQAEALEILFDEAAAEDQKRGEIARANGAFHPAGVVGTEGLRHG